VTTTHYGPRFGQPFRVLTALWVFAVFAAWCAPSASAHFYQSWYTYANSGCAGAPVDPLNLEFHGAGPGSRSWERTQQWLGWTNTMGNTHWFNTHGLCKKQSVQKGKGFQEKHHLRFFENADRSANGSLFYVFADAHRERVKYCGIFGRIPATYPYFTHAVYKTYGPFGDSGFDWGAREVVQGFRNQGAYIAPLRRGPNSRSHVQCAGKGDHVRWNGYQWSISVH